MSKNTLLSELINYVSANSSGNVTVAAPTSGLALDVNGTGRFTGQLTLGSTITNGTFTYTLPSATGTLALTSSLSGYVPYTGATASVDVGTNDLSGRYLNANGGVALGGVVNIKQEGAYIPRGNGYSSIASSFVMFDFYAYTGASTYKQFGLRFDGLTDNTTRVYTLPDASGTLALTSNLSSYLPLSGGTLTGALGGTSAAFSGNVTSSNAFVSTDGTNTIRLQKDYFGGIDAIYQTGTNAFGIYLGGGAFSAAKLYITNGGNTLIGTTTDAGFRLDVNGTGRFTTTSTNPALTIILPANANATILQSYSSNAGFGWKLQQEEVSTGDFRIFRRESSVDYQVLNLARSTGAATFSSSVTANKLITASGPFSGTIDFGTGTFKGIMDYSAGSGLWSFNNQSGGSVPTLYYQFQADGSPILNMLKNGNVGIGTTSPESRLMINGDSANMTGTITYSTNTKGIILNQDAGGGQGMGLWFRQAGLTAGIGSTRVSAGDWATDLRFYTHPSSTTNQNTLFERMRINSEGNVGIGTTSPSFPLSRSGMTMQALSSAGTEFVMLSNTDTGFLGGALVRNGADFGVINRTNGNLIFATNATERMYITSGGNVQITNPNTNTQLLIINTSTASSTSKNTLLQFQGTDTAGTVKDSGAIQVIPGGVNYIDASMVFYTRGSDSQNERMRITGGGNVLIGQTTPDFAVNGWYLQAAGGGHTAFAINNNEAFVFNNRNSGTTYQIDFRTLAVERGAINVSDSGVTYTTVSDYRLKEDFQPIQGLDKLSQINVYNYKWKINNERADGVLAHELQEVLPYAVHGEKDGAKYQGVDYSKIVPVLVKAIQEQQAQIEELKQLINK